MTFIEQPHDVRWLRELGIGTWTAQLSGRSRQHGGDAGALEVIERTTLVPPYRGAAPQIAETVLLRRILRASDRPEAVVVATTPWQWPAISRLRRARKVFDCADDWALLVPARSAAVAALLNRIGREADVVIADSPWLARLFARPKSPWCETGPTTACSRRHSASPRGALDGVRRHAFRAARYRPPRGSHGCAAGLAARSLRRMPVQGLPEPAGARARRASHRVRGADHLAWHREPRGACLASRRCSCPAAAPSARRRRARRLDEALRLRGKRQADRLDALGRRSSGDGSAWDIHRRRRRAVRRSRQVCHG